MLKWMRLRWCFNSVVKFIYSWINYCIVLQIHYLDRVQILKHKVSRTTPRAKAWTDALISERDALEIKNLGAYGKGKLVKCYILLISFHIKGSGLCIAWLFYWNGWFNLLLKIGQYDPEDNEYDGQSTELPPDLVGMLMNSGHADIGVSGSVPWFNEICCLIRRNYCIL